MSAARDIASSVAGEVLGWVLILVVLLPIFLIFYLLMKKMGYGKSAYDPRTGTHSYTFRFGVNSAPDASANQVKPAATFVPLGGKRPPETAAPSAPSQPGRAEPPGWQKEMIAAWQQEESEKRQAFVPLGGKRPAEAAALSAPSQPGLAETPSWQKEMIATWQQEETAERQASDRQLRGQRNTMLGFYKVLVYSLTGALVLAAIACFVQVPRGHTELGIFGVVLLGAAVAAGSQWNPSQFE